MAVIKEQHRKKKERLKMGEREMGGEGREKVCVRVCVCGGVGGGTMSEFRAAYQLVVSL